MTLKAFLPCSTSAIPQEDQNAIQYHLDEINAYQTMAPNTLKNYFSASNRYIQWCLKNHVVAVPATEQTLLKWAEYLVKKSTSKQAITATYRFSTVFLHKAAGLESPMPTKVKMLLKGATRTGKINHAKQSAPLRWEQIEELIPKTDTWNYSDMVSLVGIMLAYDTCTRFNEAASLEWDTLKIQDDGSAIVLLKKSKTDQESKGSIRYISKTTLSKLSQFHRFHGITSPYLIGKQKGNTQKPFTLEGWTRHFNKFKQKHNLDKNITSHAMRIGFTTDAVENGIGDTAIMQYGGWKTPQMINYYTRESRAKQGAAADLAAALNH